jgi:hypothetical protein
MFGAVHGASTLPLSKSKQKGYALPAHDAVALAPSDASALVMASETSVLASVLASSIVCPLPPDPPVVDEDEPLDPADVVLASSLVAAVPPPPVFGESLDEAVSSPPHAAKPKITKAQEGMRSACIGPA